MTPGYKLIAGKLYQDTRGGARIRILSLELEWNALNSVPVVKLPAVMVGA